MSRNPEQTFMELTRLVAELVAGDIDKAQALADLYGDTTDVSFPLSGTSPTLRHPAEIRTHFERVAASLAGRVSSLQAEDVCLRATSDPEWIVAEFRYVGIGPAGQLNMPNAIVMRVRDGQIIESRGYSAGL